MIKKLLILVFLGFSGAVLAQADARDPDKLKLVGDALGVPIPPFVAVRESPTDHAVTDAETV